MLRLWKWYQKCLTVHPVKTQIISSGFLWGVGDVAAQTITHSTMKKYRLNSSCVDWWQLTSYSHILMVDSLVGSFLKIASCRLCTLCFIHLQTLSRTIYWETLFAVFWWVKQKDADEEFRINWKRVAITSMFGFGFVGPVGHFWYEGLDRFIRLRLHLQPNSMRFVATKVAMDGIIFGPLDLFVFFSYMGLSMGKSIDQVKEDVKRDFLPALILEGGIWPLVQVANFRFVPVRYQLLYVNVFCLLDSAFLSWLEQQQDAPWKQWITSFLALEEQEGQG